MKPPIIA